MNIKNIILLIPIATIIVSCSGRETPPPTTPVQPPTVQSTEAPAETPVIAH